MQLAAQVCATRSRPEAVRYGAVRCPDIARRRRCYGRSVPRAYIEALIRFSTQDLRVSQLAPSLLPLPPAPQWLPLLRGSPRQDYLGAWGWRGGVRASESCSLVAGAGRRGAARGAACLRRCGSKTLSQLSTIRTPHLMHYLRGGKAVGLGPWGGDSFHRFTGL